MQDSNNPTFDTLPVPSEEDEERNAFIHLDPATFYIRHPPRPDELDGFITDDDKLFQTIHMGAAVVNAEKWRLVVNGLVESPFAITLNQLKKLPSKMTTAFHECYGSPLVPNKKAFRRVGNVQWTGVPLHVLLEMAKPKPNARFVWSEGLDHGKFGGVEADRYQKDLPMHKALTPEVLVAYEMNGQPLSKNRGAPVRLLVPGWFGTNSTKWLCKLSVQDRRAPGPFCTTFYNEHYPPDFPDCESRPIWEVQPNSLIFEPAPDQSLSGPDVRVEGWAWSADSVKDVSVSSDEGGTWIKADVEDRVDYSWQRYRAKVTLSPGDHTILAKAIGSDGRTQPMGEGRNHVHRVSVHVV